jgi:ribosomal protein S18 acetylase RimI-like enzyme
MPLEFKRVTMSDGALLDRVAPEVFDEPIDPERLRAYLIEPGHLMVLAIDEGEVVGQCAAIVHRHPDKMAELYIDEVGVAPTHRRQGIARRMLDEMFRLGRSLGCEEAWVGTEPDNAGARALYESFEGEPVETFVMYAYSLNPLPAPPLGQKDGDGEAHEDAGESPV